MKKSALIVYTVAMVLLAACNGPSKTGGAMTDSSASNGSSGPADTSITSQSAAPVGSSTGGSDTSTTGSGKGVANPVTDTTSPHRP